MSFLPQLVGVQMSRISISCSNVVVLSLTNKVPRDEDKVQQAQVSRTLDLQGREGKISGGALTASVNSSQPYKRVIPPLFWPPRVTNVVSISIETSGQRERYHHGSVVGEH
jgi:hypothetical protein